MKRCRKVTVRLSEDELARLKKLVDESGWSQEAYLRALIEGVVPAPRPPLDYRAMTRELRRIGVNLNQLARRANAGCELGSDEVGRMCETLDEALSEIVEAVTAPRRMRWLPRRSGR